MLPRYFSEALNLHSLIGENASHMEVITFTIPHPRDTYDLMCHQRNSHTWDELILIFQPCEILHESQNHQKCMSAEPRLTKPLKCIRNSDVIVEELRISSLGQELVDALDEKNGGQTRIGISKVYLTYSSLAATGPWNMSRPLPWKWPKSSRLSSSSLGSTFMPTPIPGYPGYTGGMGGAARG